MAYADSTAGGRTIVQGLCPVQIALSEAVEVGDLLGQSANTWKRADANNSIYAELVAGTAGASGDTITAYRLAVVGNVSGATKGKPIYLSNTAGQSDEAPGADVQIVGFSVTATEILLAPGHLAGAALISAEKTAMVSDNKTLVLADCGIVQIVDTDAKVITLPATAAGLKFIVMNGGADGAVLVTIRPQAADKISGIALTPADDKDLLNTKATAKFGDFVELVADAVDGYVVHRCAGVWAREA